MPRIASHKMQFRDVIAKDVNIYIFIDRKDSDAKGDAFKGCYS